MTKREALPFTPWELSVLEAAVRQWSEHTADNQIAKIHAEQLADRLSFADGNR